MGVKTCKNCIYLFKAENCPDTFICINKYNASGRLFILKDDQPCRNFCAVSVPQRLQIQQPADGSTRFIPLTKGRFAIVDASDFDWLNQYKWCASASRNRFFARTAVKGRGVWMHRLIMNPPAGMVVDHIDRNSLNNKRENLRICTPRQNSYNRKGYGTASKYKGVRWNKSTKRWIAAIKHSGISIYLGSFDNQIAAAKAYDKHARKLFKEFAYLNFPDESRIV